MELSIDMKLLEDMKEGVILLNSTGQITDFNRVAGPWLKEAFDAQEKIGVLITDSVGANKQFPVAVTIFDPSDSLSGPFKVYLCRSGASDYALFFTRMGRESADVSRMGLVGGYSLLGTEIRHELTQLREQLLTTSEQTGSRNQFPFALRVDRLSRLFVAIDQLTRLSDVNIFSQRKRLSLEDLIHATLADMKPLHCAFLVREMPDGQGGPHGTLYGDEGWLKCGLRGLFEGLADSGPPQSQIELVLRRSGSFVVLTGNFSAPGARGHNRIEETADLAQVAMTLANDIRAPIARRIFELHGGHLTIGVSDTTNPDEFQRGIAFFSLALPTGLAAMQSHSPACDGCAQTLQMEAYARDLAFLVQSHPTRTEVSNAEVEMLLRTLQP